MKCWREVDSSSYRYKINEKRSNQAFRKPRRSGHEVNYACVWSSWQGIWISTGQRWRHRCPITVCKGHPTQLPRTDRRSDIISAFSGHGKKSCWKTFQSHPILVSWVSHDGELATFFKEFLCHLYSTPKQSTTNHQSCHIAAVWEDQERSEDVASD